MICPLTNQDCDYCSQEQIVRMYTKVEKNGTTGMFEAKGMGKHKAKGRVLCNNHVIGKSGWVEQMTVCPKTMKPTREFVPVRLTKTGKVRKVRVQQQVPEPKKQYGQLTLL